jgi:hypothetical protein
MPRFSDDMAARPISCSPAGEDGVEDGSKLRLRATPIGLACTFPGT